MILHVINAEICDFEAGLQICRFAREIFSKLFQRCSRLSVQSYRGRETFKASNEITCCFLPIILSEHKYGLCLNFENK